LDKLPFARETDDRFGSGARQYPLYALTTYQTHKAEKDSNLEFFTMEVKVRPKSSIDYSDN
jgi:hypothetical protein